MRTISKEKVSPIRHEFVDGEVYAMAGGSDNHNRIVGEIVTTLSMHLRGSKCEPFSAISKLELQARFTITLMYWFLGRKPRTIHTFETTQYSSLR
ncbi:MAG: Uma2 family endonuclease [Acidobacteria bacterium]|nr:Uma2 family endonuclease [Acidobacteriota bacterium]